MCWCDFQLPSPAIDTKKKKKRKLKDASASSSLPLSTHTFCKCCDKGWWRPGWGNIYELIALSSHGYSAKQSEDIHAYVFQDVDKADEVYHLPCFVCNRDGMISCRVRGCVVLAAYWDEYNLQIMMLLTESTTRG